MRALKEFITEFCSSMLLKLMTISCFIEVYLDLTISVLINSPRLLQVPNRILCCNCCMHISSTHSFWVFWSSLNLLTITKTKSLELWTSHMLAWTSHMLASWSNIWSNSVYVTPRCGGQHEIYITEGRRPKMVKIQYRPNGAVLPICSRALSYRKCIKLNILLDGSLHFLGGGYEMYIHCKLCIWLNSLKKPCELLQ